jgi:hypothetical protein
MRISLSGKASRLILCTSSTVVCLLFIEALFRLMGITGYHLPRTREWEEALVRPDELLPGVSRQFKPYSSFRFRYDSNPRGYFDEDNGLTYRLNNFGFRNHDYTLKKPPGVRRIVVLGDSFAFGEGVRPQHLFCKLLEERAAATGLDVQVLNFSVGGWDTLDEISYLTHIPENF